MAAGINLWSIGHGTVALEVFVAYVRDAGIERLVDVRRFPGSRRNPQFATEPLENALAQAGIAYAHAVDLGGRRRPGPDSPNTGLRNAGFRGYADWMRGEEFRAAFEWLAASAARPRTVVMCAETPWWKCHRRLIADAAVLLVSANVTHLVSGRRIVHALTPGVAIDQTGRLLYALGQI
ncbi:MAG: DUF488 domain-containing protein [Candidatus Tumulicola sp.]